MNKTVILFFITLFIVSCTDYNESNGYFTVKIHNPNGFELLYTAQIIRHNYYADEEDCSRILVPFEESESRKAVSSGRTVNEKFTVFTGYEDDEIRIEYAAKSLTCSNTYTGEIFRTSIYMQTDQTKTIDLFIY